MKKFLLSMIAAFAVISASAVDAPSLNVESIIPEPGTELNKMQNVQVTFDNAEFSGWVTYDLIDLNPADEENPILYSGYLINRGEGLWSTTAFNYYDMKLYQGHSYKVVVNAYTSEEEKMNGAEAFASFETMFAGTTVAYQYAEAELSVLTPSNGATIKSGEITAVFTAPVETLTADINAGAGGDNAICATSASEDKMTWTIQIPESVIDAAAGSIRINVKAVDADGKVVQGNVGEEENSYFEWEFNCYNGCPVPASITPADGSVVEKLDVITFSDPASINLSYATSSYIMVYKGKEFVCVVPAENLVPDTLGTTKSMKVTMTLPQEITAPGTYQVIVPSLYFIIGEQFDSKMTKDMVLEYTIEGEDTPDVPTGEGWFSTDPANGSTVESINKVLYTFNEAGIADFDYTRTSEINVKDAEGNTVDVTIITTYGDGMNQLVVELGEAITTPGTYTITIPAGAVVTGADEFGGADVPTTEDAVVTLTIGGGDEPTPASFFTSDPASGSVVSQINKIVITMNEAAIADFDYTRTSEITIKDANGADAVSNIQCGYGDGMNQIAIECTPITADGVYTITVPAGVIVTGADEFGGAETPTTEDVVITLTIGTADGINNATIATVKDGKYVVNGKVTIIKNGKQFNAVGQTKK